MIAMTHAALLPAREATLALHRTLLDAERLAWERLNGRIAGSAEVLRLAIHDPWFAWLRPLTALIAAMDELVADASPEAAARVPILLAEARTMLRPAEDGDDFQQRYFEFVQRSPEVAVAHGALARALRE